MARWIGSGEGDPGRIPLRVGNGQYNALHLMAASDGDEPSVPVITASFYRQGAGFAEELIRGTAGVEGAEQVDIDHGFEAVGGHAGDQRREIARGRAQQNIDFAELFARFAQRIGHSRIVANVECRGFGHSSGGANGQCRGVEFLLFAAGQNYFGGMLRKAFGHALADAAAAPGHEGDFALQQIFLEDAHRKAE
jgi:hypothetical protein